MGDRQNNAPPSKNAHALMPRTYECVMLHGKKDVANGIKVADLKIGKLSWIFQVGSV